MEQRESTMVVDARIHSDQAIDGVYLETLSPDGHIHPDPISDAEVLVTYDERSFMLEEVDGEPGRYYDPTATIIQAETEVSMSIRWRDQDINANTAVPPLLTELEVTKDFLESLAADDILFLDWENLNTGSFNEWVYVIETVPLGDLEDLQPISGMEPSLDGRNLKLSYNSEGVLTIHDFDYLGEHVVRILAVHREYEVFFQPQADYSTNGPGNIQGGVGQFIGVSVLETRVDIR